MRPTVTLQAVADRVLGFVPPRTRVRSGSPESRDRRLAAAMLLISAAATIGAISLWIGGHGVAGLRLFAGTIILLLVLLRLR